MSRAQTILWIVQEGKAKAPPPEENAPAPLLYDSKAEAEKAQQIAVNKKELSKKEMAAMLNSISQRQAKVSNSD